MAEDSAGGGGGGEGVWMLSYHFNGLNRPSSLDFVT